MNKRENIQKRSEKKEGTYFNKIYCAYIIQSLFLEKY